MSASRIFYDWRFVDNTKWNYSDLENLSFDRKKKTELEQFS